MGAAANAADGSSACSFTSRVEQNSLEARSERPGCGMGGDGRASEAGQAGRLSHGKQDRRDACPTASGTLAPRESKNRAEQDCPPGFGSLGFACAPASMPPLVKYAGERDTGSPKPPQL
ncbi:MAG: hypothetical protein EBT07_19080, partial [Actinobacteria bacterium]|nr:hypothetical protein [Actinomycetota bacterium]